MAWKDKSVYTSYCTVAPCRANSVKINEHANEHNDNIDEAIGKKRINEAFYILFEVEAKIA